MAAKRSREELTTPVTPGVRKQRREERDKKRTKAGSAPTMQGAQRFDFPRHPQETRKQWLDRLAEAAGGGRYRRPSSYSTLEELRQANKEKARRRAAEYKQLKATGEVAGPGCSIKQLKLIANKHGKVLTKEAILMYKTLMTNTTYRELDRVISQYPERQITASVIRQAFPVS